MSTRVLGCNRGLITRIEAQVNELNPSDSLRRVLSLGSYKCNKSKWLCEPLEKGLQSIGTESLCYTDSSLLYLLIPLECISSFQHDHLVTSFKTTGPGRMFRIAKDNLSTKVAAGNKLP